MNVTPFQPGCCFRHQQREAGDLPNATIGTATAAAAAAACWCCAAGGWWWSRCGCACEWAGAGGRWLRGLSAGSALRSSAGATADYAAARIQLHACISISSTMHMERAVCASQGGGGQRAGEGCEEVADAGRDAPLPRFQGSKQQLLLPTAAPKRHMSRTAPCCTAHRPSGPLCGGR